MERFSVNNIREQNLELVFREIIAGEQITRNDIAARTNLSLMTVTNMVEPLLAQRIVREDKGMGSSVGRRPSFLQLNPDARWMLILDLASRDFSYSVHDLALNELERGYNENNDKLSYEENLIQFLRQLKTKMDVRDTSAFIGVGVSVAGPYYHEQDAVFCERIPEQRQIGFKKIIQSFFDTLIFIDEDVKLAAKAVMVKNQVSDMLYLYAGEGIGAGLVIKGHIYRGYAGFTGQVGHMILNGGNFENSASFRVFERRILERMPEVNHNKFKEQVVQLYRDNNPILLEELEKVANVFAQVIHNIKCLLDPEIIIIDGDYNIFGNDLLSIIGTKMPEVAWHPSNIPLKIVMSQSAIKSSIKGVGLQIREMWLKTL